MKSQNTRIPIHTLVEWLDNATNRYVRRENDLAMRAIDAIKLQLIRYLHGKNFEPDYTWEQVDEAIGALRRTKATAR